MMCCRERESVCVCVVCVRGQRAWPWGWLVDDARLARSGRGGALPSELEVAAAVAPGGLDHGLGGGVQVVAFKTAK